MCRPMDHGATIAKSVSHRPTDIEDRCVETNRCRHKFSQAKALQLRTGCGEAIDFIAPTILYCRVGRVPGLPPGESDPTGTRTMQQNGATSRQIEQKISCRKLPPRQELRGHRPRRGRLIRHILPSPASRQPGSQTSAPIGFADRSADLPNKSASFESWRLASAHEQNLNRHRPRSVQSMRR